jgi:trimethyllysine dioxygenase
MLIISIESLDDGLNVYWSNNTSSCYPWFWLRDHSESSVDLHPDTLQRQIDSFSTPLDNTVSKVWLDERMENVYIKWQDESSSLLSTSLLERMSKPALPQLSTIGSVELWNSADEIKPFPEMPYEQLMDDEDGINVWLGHVKRVGYILVRNSPATAEATKKLMERISYLRNSIFGEFSVWDNKKINPDDTAYTSQQIELHTDSTYVHDAPGLQTLHCLQKDSRGGENQLVDGIAIAELMKREHPQAFNVLCEVQVPGRYIRSDAYLETHRPVFRLNNDGKVLQVSFNNHDRAPFRLEHDEMESFYEAYGIFHRLAHNKGRHFEFLLEPGNILTFDNWRLLHGRSAFTGYRQLCGGYHNREDFESRIRLTPI